MEPKIVPKRRFQTTWRRLITQKTEELSSTAAKASDLTTLLLTHHPSHKTKICKVKQLHGVNRLSLRPSSTTTTVQNTKYNLVFWWPSYLDTHAGTIGRELRSRSVTPGTAQRKAQTRNLMHPNVLIRECITVIRWDVREMFTVIPHL